MADEKKTREHPIIDLVFRLLSVYLVATCFMSGLQNWQDGEYLKSVGWFLLCFSQIGQVFGWYKHESKIVRQLMWILLIIAIIFFVLSRLL